MQYPLPPNLSKGEIDRAGRTLASESEYIGAVENARIVTSQWRACHLKPLQVIAEDLDERLTRLGISATIARRLKRLFRIRDKLAKHPTMELTKMQDVGALRAIVPSVHDIRRLQKDFEDRPALFGTENTKAKKDYIVDPKPDGYRGIHFVFQYRESPSSAYDNIRIELQLRTNLQHEWASAVEISGLLSGQRLKYDEGDPAWKDFFKLAGELFARHEGCPSFSAFSDMTTDELKTQLIGVDSELLATDFIRSNGWPTMEHHVLLDTRNATGNEMVLLNLKLEPNDIRVTIYPPAGHDAALAAYANAEQMQGFEAENSSVVLVRVNSKDQLKLAYPTFFLDATAFADRLDELPRR